MTVVFHDVRLLPPASLEDVLLAHREGIVVSANQMSAFPRRIRDRETIAVVPDFLEYARLLSVGQGRQLIARAGGLKSIWGAALRAAWSVARCPIRAATTDFWLVAEALLRFDLALLRDFHGAVVLHPYLTDFAVGLQCEKFMKLFFHLARPWQYVGVWTYQFPSTMSTLARLGLKPAAVVFSTAQRDSATRQALSETRENPLFSNTTYLVDLEPSTVASSDDIPTWIGELPIYGVVRAHHGNRSPATT